MQQTCPGFLIGSFKPVENRNCGRRDSIQKKALSLLATSVLTSASVRNSSRGCISSGTRAEPTLLRGGSGECLVEKGLAKGEVRNPILRVVLRFSEAGGMPPELDFLDPQTLGLLTGDSEKEKRRSGTTGELKSY